MTRSETCPLRGLPSHSPQRATRLPRPAADSGCASRRERESGLTSVGTGGVFGSLDAVVHELSDELRDLERGRLERLERDGRRVRSSSSSRHLSHGCCGCVSVWTFEPGRSRTWARLRRPCYGRGHRLHVALCTMLRASERTEWGIRGYYKQYYTHLYSALHLASISMSTSRTRLISSRERPRAQRVT